MSLKQFIALAVFITILVVMISFWEHTSYVLIISSGILTAIIGFLAISPLLKNKLTHDPNKSRLGLFVQVGTGRGIAIDYGGNYYYSILGGNGGENEDDEGPVESTALFGLWMLYKRYIWWALQLHVYVPFFTVPKTYDLPRYDVIEYNGKRVYKVIDKENKRYRSNHVRIAPFTWNFEYAGAEIQTVPFIIKGSAQVRIDETKIVEAMYLTQSWNVLLDQALNSTIRSVVRSEITLDMVIGSISQDIWDKKVPDKKAGRIITQRIIERLHEYEFGKVIGHDAFEEKKLSDLGLIIFKVDITDFEYDGLSESEMTGLRAAVLGRQTGRATDQEGQGTAAAQRKIVEALQNNPDMAKIISGNEALVRAAEAGNIDALLTSFIKKTKGD
jgi:hypothetical protein